MKRISLLLLFLAFGAQSALFGQGVANNVSKKGTTAASFLSIGQGARATSMGSAFVAVGDDPSAMYWNPAGLANLEGINIFFDHTEWFADIKYNFLGASVNLGSLGAVGLNITSSSIGEMNVTTVDLPNGTGETFSVSDAAFGLSYALRLTDAFAIGFNPKIVYQKVWKTSATAVAFDMGVKYETPFKNITLGMSVSNFGQKMQLQGNSTLVLYDGDPVSTGNNGRIPANLTTGEWALPLNFRVGLAYHPVFGDVHKLIIAVDAQHPNNDYESVNIGGEYTYDNMISLRGGYKALFLTDSEEGLTLGVGVKHYLVGNMSITVDYAYQNFGRLTNIQKLSLAMSF